MKRIELNAYLVLLELSLLKVKILVLLVLLDIFLYYLVALNVLLVLPVTIIRILEVLDVIDVHKELFLLVMEVINAHLAKLEHSLILLLVLHRVNHVLL